MSEIIIGIDLGTTNSEVSVVRDGKVEMIPVPNQGCILPSVVGLDDQGNLLVGSSARNQYAAHPERTVRSIKRRMGEDTQVLLGDKNYSPQEISAFILKQLKTLAELHLGAPVGKAVITVPAFFSDAQRQATREAGQIAGLEVVRIINEPTAAALAYENHHQGVRKTLVYDLGGGTFDVSVVNIEGGVVEVLASHGNNHLGGDDFDRALIDLAIDHLKETVGEDITLSATALARLQRTAEAAKITLSDHPYATLTEEYLFEHKGVPQHLSLEVSREDYEALIEPFITETLEAVQVALKGAHLKVADIDEVLLVGGATRTPLVTKRLELTLGKTPRCEVDPDLCVAMGAAIQGALIAGQKTSTVLVDITPYTFGTSVLGEFNGQPYTHCFFPVIQKNTPIPILKSEVFFTSHDGQDKVEVNVYQGEDPDAMNNISLGCFTVEGLSDVPAGNPIVLSLSLDINGFLEVTAREKKSGLEQRITIDNAIARFAKNDLQEARDRVQAMFHDTAHDDAPTSADHRLSIEAQALIEKAQRSLPTLAGQDAEDMVNAIEGVQDAMQEDPVALQAATDVLADLLYYLHA
jgi:molecular chaperone DnaK